MLEEEKPQFSVAEKCFDKGPLVYMLYNALIVHLVRYSGKNKKGRKIVTIQKVRTDIKGVVITFIIHGMTTGPELIVIPTIENLGENTPSRIRAISILVTKLAGFDVKEIEIECRGSGHRAPRWHGGQDMVVRNPSGIMIVNILVRSNI